MRRAKLDQMIGGWFVGAFVPTVHHTHDVEVALKRYVAGDTDVRHHHKLATEITLIVEGEVRIGDERLSTGDIMVLEPGESADFEALTAATLVAIKHPGALGDKHIDA